MNVSFLLHAAAFLLLFLLALTLLFAAAHFIFRRKFTDSLDHVAMFVRPLDVLDLAALLDPMVPRTLRKSLSDRGYRDALELHIRLVREHLQRVDHNVRIIQNWVIAEYAGIAGRSVETYTARDHLVVEAQEIAKKLRRCMLAASLKLWIWDVLCVDIWPLRFLPSIPNLRVIYGMNLLASYRRLADITRSLSLEHGGSHQSAIFDAL